MNARELSFIEQLIVDISKLVFLIKENDFEEYINYST